MLDKIRRVLKILDPNQKKVIFVLQVLILLISSLEIISVLSIGPYISIISNFENFNQNKFIYFI